MPAPTSSSASPPARTLSARTAIAAGWAVSAQVVAKLADLLTLLVLARILSPQDFGLVAMAMVAVLVTEAITELPLAQALVRVDAVEASMYDTAFTLSVLRGVLIAAILLGLSWPVALFFEEPRIQLLSCVLALAPVMRGLASPRQAEYMRAMDFRPEFRMLVSARLCTLVAACSVALATGSYWAIAVGTLADPVVRLVYSYRLFPYRPALSLRRWDVFADMVGWNGASQVFAAINWQLGRIVLGRAVDASSLGLYSMATTIVALPQQALLTPLARPLIGAFTDARRRGSLGPAALQSTYVLVTIGAPGLLALAMLARPVVVGVLGPDWAASAELVRWEAVAALLGIPLGVLAPLAMSLDRTRYLTLRSAVELSLTLPAMLVGVALHGVVGASWARAGTALVLLVLTLWVVRRLVEVGAREQVVNLWRPTLSLLPMAAVLGLCQQGLPDAATGPRLVLWTGAIAAAGLLTYALALAGLWRAAGGPPGPERRLAQWVAGARDGTAR